MTPFHKLEKKYAPYPLHKQLLMGYSAFSLLKVLEAPHHDSRSLYKAAQRQIQALNRVFPSRPSNANLPTPATIYTKENPHVLAICADQN